MKKLEKFLATPSLYDQVKSTGCKMSNHYSDFYFEATPETREIVNKYNDTHKGVDKITAFIDEIDRKPWYEAKFEYDPYWESL